MSEIYKDNVKQQHDTISHKISSSFRMKYLTDIFNEGEQTELKILKQNNKSNNVSYMSQIELMETNSKNKNKLVQFGKNNDNRILSSNNNSMFTSNSMILNNANNEFQIRNQNECNSSDQYSVSNVSSLSSKHSMISMMNKVFKGKQRIRALQHTTQLTEKSTIFQRPDFLLLNAWRYNIIQEEDQQNSLSIQETSLSNGLFDEEDYRHQLLNVIYLAHMNCASFRKQQKWGDLKGDSQGHVHVCIDFQAISNCVCCLETLEDSPCKILKSVLDTPNSYLQKHPQHILPILNLAFDNILTYCITRQQLYQLQQQNHNQQNQHHQYVNVRIVNMGLRSSLVQNYCLLNGPRLNTFVSVAGQVVQMTSPVFEKTGMRNICQICGKIAFILHNKYNTKNHMNQNCNDNAIDYSVDFVCRMTNCPGKFNPDNLSIATIICQRIKVVQTQQQSPVITNTNANQTFNLDSNNEIWCDLRGTLANSAKIGQSIIINGILQTQRIFNQKEKKTFFTPYVDVNSIETYEQGKSSDEAAVEMEQKIIEQLIQTDDLFGLLIHSFCPEVKGHELVKAAMLLGIVGGNSNAQTNENNHRSDVHVLLVGECGQEQTKLLKFASKMHSQGVYIPQLSGKQKLSLNITVEGKQKIFTSGSLGFKDQSSIESIDHIENIIGTQCFSHVCSLLDTPATYTICKLDSIAKIKMQSSVFVSLHSNGKYNVNQSINENFKLQNSGFCEKFDLIMLMLDKPNFQRDVQLAESVYHLLNPSLQQKSQITMQKGNQTQISTFSEFSNFGIRSHLQLGQSKYTQTLQQIMHHRQQQQQQQNNQQQLEQQQYFQPLSTIYESASNSFSTSLTSHMLNKYLSHVKCTYKAVLSLEASQLLLDFFICLVKAYQLKVEQEEKVPNNNANFKNSKHHLKVSMSDLESLIRLAQARAKIEGKCEVSLIHAQEVCQLYQESLFDAQIDNIAMTFNGINKTSNVAAVGKQKQMRVLLEALRAKSRMPQQSGLVQLREIQEMYSNFNLNIGIDVQDVIDKLNEQGHLLKQGANLFKVL